MIISPGRKAIFVHIPKTGGTALALALEARARKDDILIGDTPKAVRRRRRLRGIETAGRLGKHARLSDLPGLLSEEEIRGMFVFTLVRNPWDRVVSYYHWLRGQDFDHPAVRLARTRGFADFVDDPLTKASLHQSPYASYVTLPSGQEHCAAFVRLESFDVDIAPVAAHLGFPLALPGRVNASVRPGDWRALYTDRTAQIVADICGTDIERFGYAFAP